MPKKILFVIATDKYFLSHRLSWATSAQKAGYTVALATHFEGGHQDFIEQHGIQTFPLHFLKRGLGSPLYDLFALGELLVAYHRFQPDLVHHVALKPIIFGSFMAKMLGFLNKKKWVPQGWFAKAHTPHEPPTHGPAIINTFGGLGFVFTKKTLLRPLVIALLRRALSHTTVIVQNDADKELLQTTKCTAQATVHCIAGAGINTDDFTIEALPTAPPYRFTFIGRLLWTKGLGELAAAARLLQQESFPFVIDVWGNPDAENPESISDAVLNEWQQQGLMCFKGYCAQVNEAYANAHVAVLPSYREGLPKSLLEAAACGRSIITTDAPGCQDVVQHGKTGWLIPVKDPAALATTMKRSVQHLDECENQGLKGRQYIQTFFGETPIQAAIIRLYKQLLLDLKG